MSSFNTIVISLAGGILPALVWLWFWLKEDRLHPEPKLRIALSFFCGMLAVWPAIEAERYVCSWFSPNVCQTEALPGFMLILIWAIIEEVLKYVFAYFSALKSKVTDEPIDSVIYMITIALGFSALENTLFILNFAGSSDFLQSIMTGNSRFLGATLLHVASSAAVGTAIGLSYYKKPRVKRLFLSVGLVVAVVLHATFNLLIIKNVQDLFFVFSGVWVAIISLIVLIEKIKKTRS